MVSGRGIQVIWASLVGRLLAMCVSMGRFKCPSCGGRLYWNYPAIFEWSRQWWPLRRPEDELACENRRRNVSFTEAGLAPKPAES